jgi:hypothetical protein
MVIVKRHVLDMFVPNTSRQIIYILHLSQTTVAETNNRERKQEKRDKSCRGCTQKLEQRDIVVQGSIQAQQTFIPCYSSLVRILVDREGSAVSIRHVHIRAAQSPLPVASRLAEGLRSIEMTNFGPSRSTVQE